MHHNVFIIRVLLIIDKRHLRTIVDDASQQALIQVIASRCNRSVFWSFLLLESGVRPLLRNWWILRSFARHTLYLMDDPGLSKLKWLFLLWRNCIGTEAWLALFRPTALFRVYTLLRFRKRSADSALVKIESTVLGSNMGRNLAWTEWATIMHGCDTIRLPKVSPDHTIQRVATLFRWLRSWVIWL